MKISAICRDNKQRVHDYNSRIQDLQRQVADAHSEKNRLEDRMLTLDNVGINFFKNSEIMQTLVILCRNFVVALYLCPLAFNDFDNIMASSPVALMPKMPYYSPYANRFT